MLGNISQLHYIIRKMYLECAYYLGNFWFKKDLKLFYMKHLPFDESGKNDD